MDAATSPTVTGFSNCRTDPSGSVMFTMTTSKMKKARTSRAFFRRHARAARYGILRSRGVVGGLITMAALPALS
jgi:hypothetical protein